MAQSAKREQDLAQLKALHDQGLLPEAAYQAALAALAAGAGEASSRSGEAYPLGLDPDGLPSYLAQPFQAYWAETHARVKLHWLVDTAEVALRWSVAVALAEVLHAGGGTLPGALVGELRQHIERPTLGRWLGMLRSLSARPPAAARLAPAVFALYERTFAPAFGTEAVGGSAEDSLLVLRNHLAHGGGLSTREAERLLVAHEERFVALLGAVVAVTEGLAVVVRTADGARRLQGLAPAPMPVPAMLESAAEGTWLVGEGGALALLPLLDFGAVTRSGPSGLPETTSDGPAAQVYARAERERLVYTPLGVDAPVAESEQVAAFRALFGLDEAAPKASATVDGYAWDGFLAEARVLAEELIGRREELKALKDWLKGRDTRQADVTGLGWVYGGPGLGKSLLMARLAADLANAPSARQGLYYHRFRSGDARNSRRAFLRGLQAALCAWPPLSGLEPPAEEADEGPKLEADVRARLAAVAELPPPNDRAPPPRFLILLDGLDECAAHEATLPRLLRELVHPGTLWLVAGRPEQGLPEAFAHPECTAVFPEGLPPMASADIRAMLLEGLGHAGHALVARDEDTAEGVSNPFVEAVVSRAAGLPLYVHLVIEDLSRGVLTVQDESQLPAGLTAYYNALLARLGVSDVQRDLTLIAALLACAEEPLTASDLALLVPGHPAKAERFAPRIAQALAAGRALLRPALTPRGEPAYALYHHSFREHVLATETLAGSVEEAREHLCQLAEAWQRLPAGNLRRHLFRWGTEYALAWQGEEGVAAAHQRLTDFAYLQARLRDLPEPADGTDLAHEYTGLLKHLPAGESHQSFRLWKSFFRERVHILRRGNEYWPAYKILLQLAVEHADDSPVTQAAEAWLAQGHCDWVWLRNARRVPNAAPSPCIRVFEGHTAAVGGAEILPDGRLLSWSDDHTLRLWDLDTGALLQTLDGHKEGVKGALVLPDGRLLSWAWDMSASIDEELGMLDSTPRDHTLRLWASDGELLTTLEGHSDPVKGATVLDDGRLLSWSEDGTLRLWDGDGQPLAILEGHSDREGHSVYVTGVTVLIDGRLLSWIDDKTLRLWDSDGRPLAILEGHSDRVTGVTVLDDERLLSWSEDGTLRLWDGDGQPLAILEGHSGWVNGAAVLDDGRLLSWSLDGTLRIWDRDGQPLAILEGHSGAVNGARVLEDGRLLSWSGDGTLRLWDKDGQPLVVLSGHSSGVDGAVALDDGRLLSWSDDHTLRLWDSDGQPLAILEGHSDSVSGVTVLEDGRLLSWSDDGTLRLWNSEGQPHAILEGHSNWPTGTVVLDDGRLLSWTDWTLSGSTDHTLRLWNSDGQPLAILEGHSDSVSGATVLDDGRLLSWAGGYNSTDHTLRLWDKDGQPLATLDGHSGGVSGAEVLDDGRLLSWSYDGTLRLWDSDGQPLAILEGHSDCVTGVTVLDDGRLLSWAAGGYNSTDHTLRLWGSDGQSLATLEGHSRGVNGARTLADGRLLSWSEDGTLRLWESDGQPVLALLDRHSGGVRDVRVLKDGRLLSWSGDGTLRLWDKDGQALAILEGHSDWVMGATVLPDGRILSWSGDGTLRLWDRDGQSLATLEGHSDCVTGVTGLDDGRLLSWSRDRTLCLWDQYAGERLDAVSSTTAPYTHPHWVAAIASGSELACDGHVGWDQGKVKVAGISPTSPDVREAASWHADAMVIAESLYPDGTLAVTLQSGHVFFLKLYHGNRRVTLAELEETYRSVSASD